MFGMEEITPGFETTPGEDVFDSFEWDEFPWRKLLIEEDCI